ncbi:MAG TPA: arylesterase [Burkholderiales bacterium]|nr:arylesterase [Burkholderiales bacterium]
MRRLLVTFLLLIVTLPAAASARTILVVGDSLSAAHGIEVRKGWVALLGERLARDFPAYRVVNASVSGDTTAGGLARLPALLKQHRPAVVIVELGGNDGLRGLPPGQMKNNIVGMITKSKTQGAKVLLLGVRLPPNYGPRYTELFRQAYRDAAQEQRVPLVPLLLDGVDEGNLMQADRIHPGIAAQPHMLDNVWSALRPML